MCVHERVCPCAPLAWGSPRPLSWASRLYQAWSNLDTANFREWLPGATVASRYYLLSTYQGSGTGMGCYCCPGKSPFNCFVDVCG